MCVCVNNSNLMQEVPLITLQFILLKQNNTSLYNGWIVNLRTMYDAVPARNVTPFEGINVLDLKPGDCCQASYEHQHFGTQTRGVAPAVQELAATVKERLAAEIPATKRLKVAPRPPRPVDAGHFNVVPCDETMCNGLKIMAAGKDTCF